MAESHRTSSWKNFLLSCKDEFLVWVDQSGIRRTMFDRLAKGLEIYLEESLSVKFSSFEEKPIENLDRFQVFQAQWDGRHFVISPQRIEIFLRGNPYEHFLNCVPGTYDDCDNISRFEQYMAPQAYAHIHLLERYRRMWDVLICLLDAGVLPMSDEGLEVLDIGTGPGPALYAVADFYKALQEFALKKGLVTPLPKLDGVELISNMQHSMHNISEFAEREGGPFWVSYRDFTKVKFAEGRYDLVIFSNFLTKAEDLEIEEWRDALHTTFRSLRHGGVALVMGGIGNNYPPIYRKVRQLAEGASIQEITRLPRTLPCYYFDSDVYAKRIKDHYTTIWTFIKENMPIDDKSLTDYTVEEGGKKKKIPKKLWDKEVGLKGKNSPSEFTLLVFQRSELPSADNANSSHEGRTSSTTEQEAV